VGNIVGDKERWIVPYDRVFWWDSRVDILAHILKSPMVQGVTPRKREEPEGGNYNSLIDNNLKLLPSEGSFFCGKKIEICFE
jgi:hypothetical protein